MPSHAVANLPPQAPARTTRAFARGGLAPHMLLRAQASLLDNLGGRRLRTIAGELGLSPDYFGRAFRKTAGLSPHQWRMNARIAAAKAMIVDGPSRLADVALACGFSDQAHLTRVFKRQAGLSPAAWRRSQAHQPLIARDLP